MGSPVDMPTVNREEVDGELDAILSIDTTKGNRVINHRGFAFPYSKRRIYTKDQWWFTRYNANYYR